MNTTPSISKVSLPTYTMTGGKSLGSFEGKARSITVVVMRRSNLLFDPSFIRDVMEIKPAQVIVVNSSNQRLPEDSLLESYTQLQFLSFKQDVNLGTQINVAVREAKCPWVMIVWDDMSFMKSLWAEPVMYRLTAKDFLLRCPVLKNMNQEVLPTATIPAFKKHRFYTVQFQPSLDEDWSLYPYDYCGLYSRQHFLQTGGYDQAIDNPYWQKMDFGMRAWLWGYKILVDTSLVFTYRQELQAEDSTTDRHYGQFFLKNLAVRFVKDHGVLKFSTGLRYALRSGQGLFEAFSDISKAGAWVKENKFRFKNHIRGLVSCWKISEQQ